MPRVQRIATKTAPRPSSKSSPEPKKDSKATGRNAKPTATPARVAKAKKVELSPSEVAARAAVASVYSRLDAWESGSVFTSAPSTPVPDTGRTLGKDELAALENTEALWRIR